MRFLATGIWAVFVLAVPLAVAGQTETSAALDNPPVNTLLTGVDVLAKNDFEQLAGRRIGLITNHTGRDRNGRSTVQLLHDAQNLKLVALFSPEHGFEGKLDKAKIADTKDQRTGLAVYSLYGETRVPTAAMLRDIDTLVFDIQDIGTRFYTYISTMGEAMKAAAKHHKRFVVLDRPNPINGVDVAGPMLDEGRQSFVAFHRLPVRHGMTAGELARLFKRDLNLDLELDVIACEGWKRKDSWDETGLVWVNPSPNMRGLTQAWLYPGIGLLEMTNVSVGCGTDTPFEIIGAPWIDGQHLAAGLRGRSIRGAGFVPIEFTPTASKFAGQKCGGVNIVITDRRRFEPLRTGFEIAAQLRRLYHDAWDAKEYMRLLGNQRTLDALLDGKPADEIEAVAREGMQEFNERRREVLLYE